MRQYFFDMDGLLAVWDPSETVEATRKEGYFLTRKVEQLIKDVIKKMQAMGEDVTILSSAYLTTNAREEKEKWLKDNDIDIPAIFVPYGLSKTDFLPDTGDTMVLIDDYSRNLREWVSESPRHKGVKYRNGINGRKGTWKGTTLYPQMEVDEIIEILRTC